MIYSHEIRVSWGDCDPARIAYTGNIPAWALEAINGWWEAHLDGDGWFQMELDRGFADLRGPPGAARRKLDQLPGRGVSERRALLRGLVRLRLHRRG